MMVEKQLNARFGELRLRYSHQFRWPLAREDA